MSDVKYNISLHANPIVIKNNNVILYKNQKGDEICISKKTLSESNIIHKNYIIQKTPCKTVQFNDTVDVIDIHHKEPDELVVSETESLALYSQPHHINNISIIYDAHLNQYTYNVFHMTLFENNVQCYGFDKSSMLSYELVLNKFVGICVYCEMNIEPFMIHDKMYIVYSNKVTDNKCIKLKNPEPYYLTNHQDELSYYPIYVICCQSKHTIDDFVQIYPYLVKNIFHYHLK